MKIFFLAQALLFVSAEAAVAQTKNGFELRGALVPPAQIESGGPPKDGIPAIDRPKFVKAGEARFLQGDDRVLGVVLRRRRFFGQSDKLRPTGPKEA